MQIYLDACILIFLIESHPRLKAPVRSALRERRGSSLCWTEISRLEVLVKPVRDSDCAGRARYEHFLASPATRQVPLSRKVFELAIELRARHGLKTPDALHLAAAIEGRCDELWTNDRRLEKAAEGRIAIVAFN